MVAGELLVDLDVNDPTAGTASWTNKGTLGGAFAKQGNPMKGKTDGKDAIVFNGGNDVYVGPNSTGTIEGNSDRTIELWVLKPTVDNNEAAMLSWADRQGATNGRMMSFNYCKDIASSAMSHWEIWPISAGMPRGPLRRKTSGTTSSTPTTAPRRSCSLMG